MMSRAFARFLGTVADKSQNGRGKSAGIWPDFFVGFYS
jgi:hypothetical protein